MKVMAVNEFESQGKEDAYEDRNTLVLSFLRSMKLVSDLQDNIDVPMGWKESEKYGRDWVLVWAELPEGQVSWHMKREKVQKASFLEQNQVKWDGHTRIDKNQRLMTFVQKGR